MAIQVLRFKARPEITGGLVSHIMGHSRPGTARGNLADPVVVLVQDRVRAQAILNAKRAARKARRVRGPKPCPAVEFVLAGPPAYGSPGEWDRDRELEWAVDAVGWLRDLLGPRSVIVAACLHRDETSPHVHVLAVPVAPDGELGWTNHLKEIGESRCGIPVAKQKRGRVHSALQDDFHRRVSARYGLGRGEKGSKATHKQIDRMKAAQAAVVNAEKEARKLAEGDEAIGRSKGIVLSAKGRKGRKERERLERERNEATEKVGAIDKRAREAVVKLCRQVKALTGEVKAAKEGEAAAFAKGKAEGKAELAEQLAKAQANAKDAAEKAHRWADYAKRLEGEREAVRKAHGKAMFEKDTALDRMRGAVSAAEAKQEEAEARAAAAEAKLYRLRAGLGHGHGAAGVAL